LAVRKDLTAPYSPSLRPCPLFFCVGKDICFERSAVFIDDSQLFPPLSCPFLLLGGPLSFIHADLGFLHCVFRFEVWVSSSCLEWCHSFPPFCVEHFLSNSGKQFGVFSAQDLLPVPSFPPRTQKNDFPSSLPLPLPFFDFFFFFTPIVSFYTVRLLFLPSPCPSLFKQAELAPPPPPKRP